MSELIKSIEKLLEKAFSSKIRGLSSPTKNAASRYFAREQAEEQKEEDVKHKIDRPRILETPHEVTPIKEGKILRYRPLNRSEESVELIKAIDVLLEKAVYGAGTRQGKIEEGTHKDPEKHGKAKRVFLSSDRKKEILDNLNRKAKEQAERQGLYSHAKTFKSLDERTVDYIEKGIFYKSKDSPSKLDYDEDRMPQTPEAVAYEKEKRESNKKYMEGVKTKVPNWAIKQGHKLEEWEEAEKSINLSKEEIIRRHNEPGAYKAKKNTSQSELTSRKINPKALEALERLSKKSLDERTVDLVKSQVEKSGTSAAQAVFSALKDNISPKKYKKLVRVSEKAAKKYLDYPDKLYELVSDYNNSKTIKSVVDTWKKNNSLTTQGNRIVPVGPGGQIQDLSKDEDEGAE
jgi:hypothetical protein